MIRAKRLRAVKAAVLAAAIPILIQGFSGGPPAGRTGAPGDLTCATAGCHFGTQVANSGDIRLQFPSSEYTPGETQRWTVSVSRAAAGYGFQLTVRDGSNAQAGVLAPVDGTTQTINSGPRQYIEHTAPSGAGTFLFDWTAPETSVGPVTAYVAVNAANLNGTPTGDTILLNSFVLPAGEDPAPRPTIEGDNPVVNGASFQPGIVAGSWVTIFGSNLAPTTRIWDAATEIIAGALPTELDGVSVRINGKMAAVFFISPTQLNVQAPDDTAEGPVNVEVIRDGVASDPAVAELRRNAPGFFLFEQGSGQHVAAVHAELDNGQAVFVGPEDLFGGAALARPARSGEVILLFGTGFGPTDPAAPAGQVFAGASPLVDEVTIRFGEVVATDVQFAGLSGAGLYQFNVRVPDGLAAGEMPLTAEIGGTQSQDGVVIAVVQ